MIELYGKMPPEPAADRGGYEEVTITLLSDGSMTADKPGFIVPAVMDDVFAAVISQILENRERRSERKTLSKCESCVHKKRCIDSANYKYAQKCRGYKKIRPHCGSSNGR